MARYFFDTNDGTLTRDEIGQEVEDWKSLREEALIIAAERSAQMIRQDESYAVVLTVRDGRGNHTLTMRLACQIEDVVLKHSDGQQG